MAATGNVGFGSNDLGAYFSEVAQHFATLEDEEEKALLAANAVEEVAGQEVQAATSPATAFTLEKLLAAADAATVVNFLTAVLETPDAFGALATHATGSRILESLLQKLGDAELLADVKAAKSIHQVLQKVSSAVVDHLGDCITDRCGSHVARQLLSVAAGRDVSPAAARKPKSTLFEDEPAAEAPPQAGGAKTVTGLAARLAVRAGAGAGAEAPFPQVIRALNAAVLEPDGAAGVADMAYHTHASLFLQTLLHANAGNGEALEGLAAVLLSGVPLAEGVGDALEGVRPADVHEMMNDRTGSHVLEAVFATATDELYSRLFERILAGSMLELAMHPSANFVLQAALSSARNGSQVKAALAELQDSFGELLSRRRSGVVAALLAATSRLGAAQSDACRALSRGLTAMPAADVEKRGLAAALLTLDGAGQLGAVADAAGTDAVLPKHRARLSAPGCAMLALLLRFPLDASQKFCKAVALLAPADAARVGLDPGGTRVLEAFIQGKASAKQKRTLIRALAGSWGALAAEFGGSHLVEKCFEFAGINDKEAIVQELVAARRALYVSGRGGQVLRSTGADVYVRSPAEWRQRSTAAAAVRSDFAEMLDDTPAAAAEPVEAAAAAAAPACDEPGGRKRKKRKQHAGSTDAPEVEAVAEQQAAPPAERPEKKKKKKKQKPADVPKSTVKKQKTSKRDRDGASAGGGLGGKRTDAMLEMLTR